MFEVLWVLSLATLSSTFKNSASPKKCYASVYSYFYFMVVGFTCKKDSGQIYSFYIDN